ncbi:MAG: ABC transporter permease [Leadbetterella sp.]
MNVSFFIANKLKSSQKRSFSSTIIRIGIISVAFSVTVLILSFFVLIGFKDTIKKKLFAQTSHIQVSKISSNKSFEESPLLPEKKVENQVKSTLNVKSFNRVAYKSVILKTNKNIEGVVFKGVDREYDWDAFKSNIVEGRLPNCDSSSLEVIISKKTSEIQDIQVGANVLVYFIKDPPSARKLKVVGFFDTGIEEFDKIYIFGSLGLLQKVNNWNSGEIGHYETFLKSMDNISITESQLLKIFNQTYSVQPIHKLMPQFYDWFELLDRNIWLIIFLILGVAGFNMISILLIMIMERTPMIGVLNSLGASLRQQWGIFIINAAKICLWGLLWGNIVGLAIAFIQYKTQIIKLDTASYYVSYVPIKWDFNIWILINLGIFFTILLICLFPIFLIKRIKIVEAIKYKD